MNPFLHFWKLIQSLLDHSLLTSKTLFIKSSSIYLYENLLMGPGFYRSCIHLDLAKNIWNCKSSNTEFKNKFVFFFFLLQSDTDISQQKAEMRKFSFLWASGISHDALWLLLLVIILLVLTNCLNFVNFTFSPSIDKILPIL